ncbi:hypothetical protein BJP41_09600 [Candidatus Williamhamiltonella defendens]|uniref:Rho-GAP domain-containing protein n=1 Tax=Candidatus Williamhamiltonella defendens TaxID=138072 RepID=A0A2D3T430_9ENTR|nr:RhoGAP domain-containing protein [Candidatus Hamiltonella defensa]ATW30537.1 hypothetical protein BJP41_09600 [Candidatus Hamiltonella defensa]
MPINPTLQRSHSSGHLSEKTSTLHRSEGCGSLNHIPDSTSGSRLNFFKAVKNTTENTKFRQKREEGEKTTVTKTKISKDTNKDGKQVWLYKSNFRVKSTGTSSSSTAKPNIEKENKFEFRKPRPIQFTQASSAQVSEPVQQQEERPETVSAQKKNKLSRLWQGIKEVFSFLFRSCFPRTKTKSNDATTISKTEIAGGKTVSKDTLNELLKKIDELIKTEGLDGLFRESGSSSHLNELTQQVNSGEKVDIDKIDNRDTAIGFFKRIMERVTPLKYEEVQTILSNKITHKEIGEELSKIINSKYPEEFLMILKTLGKFFEKASNNENSKFNVTSFTRCIPNLIKCESGKPNLLLEQSKEIPKMIEKILHKDTLEAIFTNITITSL